MGMQSMGMGMGMGGMGMGMGAAANRPMFFGKGMVPGMAGAAAMQPGGGLVVGRGPDGQPIVQQMQKKALSPHAGSRAIAAARMAARPPGAPAPAKRRSSSSRSPSKKASSSSRNSSSSSDKKKKKKKKKKGKKKKKSKSRSTISSSEDGEDDAAAASALMKNTAESTVNSEVEVAKREAVLKLQELQSIDNKDERAKQWRLLLRNWHPDKNPDKAEVATEVFQFLQKGKSLINL